ncbi:hypothetical protein QZH41_019779, partial [Actinostola sp. cb2023]
TLADSNLIKVPYLVPCTCPPGQGLTNEQKAKCQLCNKGSFSSGGEDISDWGSWTQNGTSPPPETGITTSCEIYRSYVKPCEHWKASYFNDSLESGDNAKTRCMSSVLMMRKQFVGPNNYVKFKYRVEGRKCYSNYVGCDGLGFFVDNKRQMPFIGNQFVWKTKKFNITSGFHQLKWVYRKNCYSFPTQGLADKAFIQSITLVGTLEPQTKCKPCPPGTYSITFGASECTKCDYFKYQSNPGAQSCSNCLVNSYSMLGSAYCIPMFNCTDNDLVKAPESLKKCTKAKDNVYMRKIIPEYSSVTIKGKPHTLCVKPASGAPPTENVPCSCQPGQEYSPDVPAKSVCKPCAKGKHSKDGRNCTKCPSGHVALMGKHVYIWTKDDSGKLPEGFTAGCIGDCSKPDGWYPSGNHIRTSRVVGDVNSFIQSGKYEIASNIAYILFNCSVLCNITQPTSSLHGNHLADINYCNLVFQVWANGSLSDQVNCTKPKGKYVYRHEGSRDGKIIAHNYPLKKGSYQFRWIFNQQDELKSVSAAFEAKVFNISIVGVRGGSAISCTPCGPGYYSVFGNTDCSICPKGKYSQRGSDRCIECKKGTFADAPGSGECLPCGTTTTNLPARDGCTNNDCKFSPQPGVVEYDFSELSRDYGPMFEVLSYQTRSYHRPSFSFTKHKDEERSSGRIARGRLSIWPPYSPRFYVNLCSVKHDNTSCTFRTSQLAQRQSLPVMGCRTSWWSRRDTSIGRVIGFKPKKDIASGVMVELLHGDICLRSSNQRYNTTIDLTCDVDAGVGNPGPENNYTQVFRPPCRYYFKWRSLYACPKCRKEDFEKVTHECVNGSAKVTIARKVPCWGTLDGLQVGVNMANCSTGSTDETVNTLRTTIRTVTTVNKVLIGVGVVIIVALLIVAGYFYYKHRDIKYKYYGTLARNKPMSKLEEEEEDFGQVEGDVFNDTRNMINS